jgi:outer membrane immunogenic protein
MNKLLLTSGVLLGLTIGHSALAADMPIKAPPFASPSTPAFSWTGFYIGGTAGGAWSRARVSVNTVDPAAGFLYRPGDIPGLDALGSPSLSGSTAIFGGKIGYNQQWSSLVVGLEGDISSFHFNRSAFTSGNPFTTPPAFPSPPGIAQFNTNISTSWLATIRPRIGYATDKALFYGTAGAAFANVGFSNVFFADSPLGAGPSEDNGATSASKTKVGWAAGGGIDYALTNNWIVSVEYLHVDLGSIAASEFVISANGANATLNYSTKLQSDLVRGGLSYKF